MIYIYEKAQKLYYCAYWAKLQTLNTLNVYKPGIVAITWTS